MLAPLVPSFLVRIGFDRTLAKQLGKFVEPAGI
jgi:hypothetical protein